MSPKIEESKNKRLRGSLLSTDAFLLFDDNLNLVDINDAGQRLFDVSAEAALGKCIMDVMPDIKKSDIYNKYRHILKTGEPLVIHQKLGDRSLAAQVFKLGDSLGIIVSDITERKRAEEERELVLAELAEKTKELEQVIYLTSHDLRSPLVNIQGFSKELDEALKKFYAVLNKIDIPPALRKKLASTMNGDLAKSLQYIIASSAKMDSLLSGLLKLSRMGRDTLRIKKLDMSKLISKVISSFEFQIKEVDATVKVEELPPCYGDETQIDQVFSNLVGNALKFLDPKRRGVIRVSGKEEKEQAVYCVEDNGIGIAEKDKDAIFEMFRKLNPDDKRGEGLGLTIVRKILDRHGGKVWVESEPGKGSKFFVSLPDISLSV
ncbi:MAG: ATP-binding protein [Chloroflexi bacterium]|jgi:signal transduction histidine kinase|nr:ATP-binding protein [Chloroflexota bacterium]